MASTTRKIPPTEWGDWKKTILALATSKATLKDVQQAMERKGFSASISQYEAQLKAWDHRKNLKRHEWAIVLVKLDDLVSQQKQCRLRICGQLVSPAKIQTARRRYCKEYNSLKRGAIEGTLVSNLQNVVIEVLELDGTWSSHANFDEDPHFEAVTSLPGLYLPGSSSNFNMPDGSTEANVEITCPPFDPEGAALSSSVWFPTNSMVCVVGPGQTVNDTMHLGFPSFYLSELRDLPFERFTQDPKVQYAQMFFRPNCAERVCSQQSLSSGSKTVDVRQLFMAYTVSIIQGIPGEARHDLVLTSRSLPSIMRRWPIFDDQEVFVPTPMLKEEKLQINFHLNLVRSVVNGFAGLGNLPMYSILKYLSMYEGIDASLVQLLRSTETLVARALAEKLFIAFIEQKDCNALRRLLATRLVDVNSAVCVINGEKFTPIERAARLQDLDTIVLFLDDHADVNKTFAFRPSDGGAVFRLLQDVTREKVISENFLSVLDVLLQAGGRVHSTNLSQLPLFGDYGNMIKRLVLNMSDFDHSQFLKERFLSTITRLLDDRQAMVIATKILLECQQTDSGGCLIRYSQELDWAFIQGARSGLLNFVRLLLPYSKTPYRALSAAIRNGDPDIIETILTLKPDMNGPAHSIEHDESGPVFDCNITSTYAEAIRARNERMILEIESANTLEHLDKDCRFEAAIIAASEVGDLSRVKKLLGKSLDPSPRYMGLAASQAIKNGNDELFWTLHNAGASPFVSWGPLREQCSPLNIALKQRKLSMVRGMLLDVDIVAANTQLKSSGYLFEEIYNGAVECGDIAILRDLRTVFPTVKVPGRILLGTLKHGNTELCTFLSDSGMVHKKGLTYCLADAFCKDDLSVIRYLIERGADVSDPDVLSACAYKHPESLGLLLDHIPRSACHFMSGFGTGALNMAIGLGRTGFGAVATLLESGLVDVRALYTRPMREISPRRRSPAVQDIPIPEGVPLEVAIEASQDGQHEDFLVIRKLLEAGCDANGIFAYQTHNYTSLESLSFGYKASQGNLTALLKAIETRDKDLVQLMISYGASVTREATLGITRTPLQKAVEVESLEIIRLLVSNGADVNEKPATRGGATALQLAAITGNCQIAAELLERGANQFAPLARFHGRRPLEGAAEHGRIDMIQYLWRVSFGIDKAQCQKAMKLAEENGHLACRDLIAKLLSESQDHWLTFGDETG